LTDQGQSRSDLIEVGQVSLIDDLPADARKAFDQAFEVSRSDDRAAALEEVRKGDADVAVEMEGNTLVAHYSEADQVKAAVTRGTLSSFVNGANIAATGEPPTYTLRAERVEDESL